MALHVKKAANLWFRGTLGLGLGLRGTLGFSQRPKDLELWSSNFTACYVEFHGSQAHVRPGTEQAWSPQAENGNGVASLSVCTQTTFQSGPATPTLTASAGQGQAKPG